MKKQSELSLTKTIAVTVVIAVSAAMFLWIYLASDVEDIRFNDKSVRKIVGEFKVNCVSDSGESTIEAELPSRLETAKAGDTVIISKTLRASEISGEYIAFYRQQSWVDVYLDGELLAATERNPDLPFSMSAGSHWYIVKLPADFDGKELRVEMTAQFDEYAPVLPELYTGSKSSIVYMVLHKAKFSILIGFPTMTLGITCVLFGLLLQKKKTNGRIILLGLLAVTISVWYLLESRATQLFFGNIPLLSYLLFTCYNLIPVLTSALLLTFETFNKHKYVHAVFWISVASFLAVQALQVSGAAYYIELIAAVHILLILIILSIIASYIYERKSKKPTDEMYIYKALLILSGFSLVDLTGFYVQPAFMVGTASKIGLMFFIIYLIYTAFRQFYETEIDIAKNEVYHELAVKDLMTGLANRTAFEQEMFRLRTEPPHDGEVYFLFADVDNMKAVNDNYGHTSGDDCLIKTAGILMECFPEPSCCYRIGGDEFCVICKGLAAGDIDKGIERLYSLVSAKNKETVYPYAVACGYHIIDGEGADACLKKADAEMYKKKIQNKNQV